MIKSLSDLIGQDDIIVIGIDIGFRTTGFVADRLVFRDGKITEEVIWCDTFKTDANAKKRHIYVADWPAGHFVHRRTNKISLEIGFFRQWHNRVKVNYG